MSDATIQGAPYRKRIRRLRETRGWSQERLAQEMSVLQGRPWHQSVPSKIEKGERHLTLDEAVVLSRLFGITLDQLVSANTERVEVEV